MDVSAIDKNKNGGNGSAVRVMIIIPPTRLHINRDIGFKERLPHIGVAYIAASFAAGGADVRVLDCPAEGIGLKPAL